MLGEINVFPKGIGHRAFEFLMYVPTGPSYYTGHFTRILSNPYLNPGRLV